jgi:hypothetical protein
LKKYIAERLATFGRKVLRRLCGGIKGNENGESCIVKN